MGGRAKRQEEGGPSRRAPRPEALISFHLSTLQQIPRRVPGPCGFCCGRGEDGGREADGPIVVEHIPLTHSRTQSPRNDSPEALPACHVDSMQAWLPGKNASPPLLSLTQQQVCCAKLCLRHETMLLLSFLLFRPHGQ